MTTQNLEQQARHVEVLRHMLHPLLGSHWPGETIQREALEFAIAALTSAQGNADGKAQTSDFDELMEIAGLVVAIRDQMPIPARTETNKRPFNLRDAASKAGVAFDRILDMAKKNRHVASEKGERAPDGYHYVYRDPFGNGEVIRQNNGQEVNGSKPLRAHTSTVWPEADREGEAVEVTDAMVQRAMEAASAASDKYVVTERMIRAALTDAPQGITVEAERDACKWAQEDEYGYYFDTSCGHTYIVNDGETGGMKFCTFCGRRIEFVMWTDDSDNLQADAGGE